eukprot:CAMPEP_0115252392 /NCGR_PEP_ID=MMETSP0270-20121206/44121_1 /TAXON_ID=71861 /ORGANISM="Scrippsiella trochoidea, Strain CCMP3099" /LENGTH=74 /DNA_ID=CAMNT_0002667841 /DNA_START=388 /DNA_END=612 /DNA_ORIENTATION=-
MSASTLRLNWNWSSASDLISHRRTLAGAPSSKLLARKSRPGPAARARGPAVVAPRTAISAASPASVEKLGLPMP